MMETTNVHVGTSGFSYPEWRPGFYPEKLPQKQFLAYYAQHHDTTEINNTFYRIPSRKLTSGWYETVPQGFLFALKLSQRITHFKRLKNVDEEMQWFMSGALELQEKLGPILVQLPPNFQKDKDVLEAFLAKHASRSRLAFEFRHDSWFDDEVYDLLRQHDSALTIVEPEPPKEPTPRLVTGSFVYMRLRKGEYSKAELESWARWIREQSVEVYCYMKHEAQAPALVRQLLDELQKDPETT